MTTKVLFCFLALEFIHLGSSVFNIPYWFKAKSIKYFEVVKAKTHVTL